MKITEDEFERIEQHIHHKLIDRGFSNDGILNNRGLIGVIVEDMMSLVHQLNIKGGVVTGMFKEVKQ